MMQSTIQFGWLRSIKSMMKNTWGYLSEKYLPGNARSIQQLPPPGELLTSIARDLLDDSRRVEPNFLEMGRDLMQIHEEALALGQHSHEAVGIVNGDEGVLRRIDRVVQTSLSQLHLCRDQVHKDLGRLAEGAKRMGDLCGFCAVFDKMVLELQMIGLNIGVESVRSSEGRTLFGHLASDVRQLSCKIAGIAANIHADAQRTGGIQEKANQDISKVISTMTDLAADAEVASREAVDDMKGLMSLSASTLDEIGKHSRRISERVGRVVEGIQFHDNMHQRITHVAKTLSEMACPLSTRKEAPPHVHAALALQAAQLNQLLCEVERARNITSGAFDEIAQCLDDLSGSLSMFSSGREDTSPGAGGFDAKRRFAKIDGVIKHFNEIIAQSLQLHERILEVFGNAESSLTKLSEATKLVRQINFEIHLMALNAIVRSAQLGSKGQALEALAYAINDLSDKSGLLVSQVDALISNTSHTETAPPRQIDVGEKNRILLEESNIEIRMAYEQLDSTCIEISTRSKALMQLVLDTRRRLSFMNDIEERLRRHLHTLESYIYKMPSPGDMSGTIRVSDINRLKSRYTIAQERIVHEDQMDQTAACGAIRKSGSAPGNSGEKIFGVPHLPKSPSVATPTESELGYNVELF